MRFLRALKQTFVRAFEDVSKNHTLAFSAALSYYFVLSFFPLLIFLSAAVALLPVPNLFEEILVLMSRVVPPDGMGVVRAVLKDVIRPESGAFLSLGLLGTLWAASGGFAAMIEALDVAYDVPETRPIWRVRLLALELALVVGLLMVGALALMIVGPRFGEWLAAKLHLSPVWAFVWPYLRWAAAIAFTVLAVEMLYFLAPNVRQRFRCTVLGAVVAVAGWIGLSYLLGIYFRSFANFNKTYGTLGAAIALMMWFYWSGFAIMLGAEINSEFLQVTGTGKLPLKRPPPQEVRPRPTDESQLAA